MLNLWKTNPAVRMAARTVVVAVVSYAATSLSSGITDWKSFAGGLFAAAVYAIVGLLTPVEPKVGIKTTVK